MVAAIQEMVTAEAIARVETQMVALVVAQVLDSQAVVEDRIQAMRAQEVAVQQAVALRTQGRVVAPPGTVAALHQALRTAMALAVARVTKAMTRKMTKTKPTTVTGAAAVIVSRRNSLKLFHAFNR